ncbi:MAG: hypothetical protein QW134_07085, partial [Nitrososphaeria archaeon]
MEKDIPILVVILLLLIILYSALEISDLNISNVINIVLLVAVAIILVLYYLVKKAYYNIKVLITLVFLAVILLLYNTSLLGNGINSIIGNFKELNTSLITATGIIASLSPLIALELLKAEDTRKISNLFLLISVFSFISLIATILSVLLVPSLSVYTSSLSLKILVSILIIVSLALFLLSVLLVIFGILTYANAKGLFDNITPKEADLNDYFHVYDPKYLKNHLWSKSEINVRIREIGEAEWKLDEWSFPKDKANDFDIQVYIYRVWNLLNEAKNCYITGLFNSTITIASIAVESLLSVIILL